jgi:two-component system cell cycle sensor histidine kinase/response regulator CckA
MSAQPTDLEGRGELILVVEDEAALRQVLQAILESHNYRLTLVGTGQEALQVWETRADEVDLLLTDVIMPDGMSGGELARRLQQARPNLKTILCSGYSASVLEADMPHLQHAAFLQKPYRANQLLRLVRDMLDGVNPPLAEQLSSSE